MSTATANLIASFEALPVSERQEFVKELLHRLPRLDSGPLDDEMVAETGDDLAAALAKEEHDAATQ
jgi:hypothetical protein